MAKGTYTVKKMSGFSLIEALIALVVLSFGLLAVAKFQSTLVAGSAYSKARSEAVQLAQQKLDELRTYSTEPGLVANLMDATLDTTLEFTTDVVDQTYPTTAEAISGVNADFSRQWDVACAADSCSVVVNVSWTDLRQGLQTVSLNTNLGWKNPRGTADLASNDFTPLVPSATGRAYLGDGTVTQDQLDAGTANDDGTVTIFDVGDDTVLVDTTANDDGTYNIVLTLEDACVSGSCLDFVKISGRVYRDIDGNPTVDLADIYVLASDAAYCARDIPNITTTSPNGNYEYYDYTCYLGGGWHGNIGVIFNDGGNQDYACIGDPTSPNVEDGDGTNNWRQMELAIRRVYRGMTFIGSASSPVLLPEGTLYYSQGIGDAVVLPDPAWPARYYGHDFVVTRITGTATGTKCLNALTRADSDTNSDGSAGDLFYGVSTDFVCLNEELVPETFKYLDTFKTGHYAKNYCPYDPSRGPALAYYVTGTVSVSAPAVLDGTEILNSVNPDNCSFVESLANLEALVATEVTGKSSVNYACLVYDWGNGWTGSVYVTPGPGLLCDPAIDYTAITSNQTGQNFACVPLAEMTITGSLTAYMNDVGELAGTTVTAVRTNLNGTLAEPVECDVMPDSGTVATYSCTVYEEAISSGWWGTVTATPPAGITCNQTSKTWAEGEKITADATAFDAFCSGPVTTLPITGILTGVSDTTAATLPLVSSNTDGACEVLRVDGSWDFTYTCDVTFNYLSGWTGTITVSDPVDNSLSCTGETIWGGSGITESSSSTALVSCNTTDDVFIRGSISVYYPSDTAYCEDLDSPLLTHNICPAADQVTSLAVAMEGDPGYPDGACELESVPALLDGYVQSHAYSCVTTKPINKNQRWSGDVIFTTNGTDWARICSPNPISAATGVATLLDLVPGSVTYQDARTDAVEYCSFFP
ncbi:MAG: prepilin-type N-terminal cleavage/methylation domain-containing protein [Gammaproteobacteria bacterium]|nr:prepilin-type N-terminal cleavage/methylation domain-containing protein [Gammaproteobacteria bacterium]